jgi:hypothetical protein
VPKHRQTFDNPINKRFPVFQKIRFLFMDFFIFSRILFYNAALHIKKNIKRNLFLKSAMNFMRF